MSAHFPNLRSIKNLIYTSKKCLNDIYEINEAFNNNDVDKLKRIANAAEKVASAFKSTSNEICLNETELKNMSK